MNTTDKNTEKNTETAAVKTTVIVKGTKKDQKPSPCRPMFGM